MEKIRLEYPISGAGRPQIVLVGNGLERADGQPSWGNLLKGIAHKGCFKIDAKDRVLFQDREIKLPFPLLYHFLTTGENAPEHFSADEIASEEAVLRKGIEILNSSTTELNEKLAGIGADHIFSTNYAYCLESAFGKDMSSSRNRSKVRFDLRDESKPKEVEYRLHTGYHMNKDDHDVYLWHIHGEKGVPNGIVLGHDRYGRLLKRIIDLCKESHSAKPVHRFQSWPELFLYGDVYIVGFGFETSEFDLWWLLRRKQREIGSAGHTYFYEMEPENGFVSEKHLLLKAYGVQLCGLGHRKDDDFKGFYNQALDDIQAKIKASR